MALFGTTPLGRKWAPRLVISGDESPAEQFVLDPALPTLGRDPYIPNNDYVVIPRGRFLAIKNPQTSTAAAYAQTGRPVLSLANGSEGLVNAGGISTDLKAVGFSETQYFRQFEEKVQPFPQITRRKLISLPYIQASNGAYGPLKPGDKVTAYYGSATSAAVNPQDVGKAVKWVPRTLYAAHQGSASTTIPLPQAIYPAFQPTVVVGWNAGTLVPITSAVYSYSSNQWSVTVNAAVTDVLYNFGQREDNIAGVVTSFEAVGTAGGQLSSPHKFAGWLEWVHDNFSIWAFPPETTPRPFSTSTNETPTQIDTNLYKLANFPIVPVQPITITVTGTRVDPLTGLSTSLTNYVLPLADTTYFQDWTLGADYEVNPVTGILRIFNNITVSSITVTYEYETAYLDGRLYDAGQIGLTDGQFSGVRGTPANLELFGVVADMHIITI